jgi:hypothetical protein
LKHGVYITNPKIFHAQEKFLSDFYKCKHYLCVSHLGEVLWDSSTCGLLDQEELSVLRVFSTLAIKSAH